MKLLIISNMAHYLDKETVVGWGPTVREINAMLDIFEEITHIGCLHSTSAPKSSLPYSSANIKFIPVPPTGGNGLWNKLNILWHIPLYVSTMLKKLGNADVVHVRAPANIPLIALIVLAFYPKPIKRWVKYAGNWKPEGADPISYRIQRWLIDKNVFRGFATINGEWADQAKHIHSFLNPCFTVEELYLVRQQRLSKEMIQPVEIIFVGRVEEEKGAGRTIKIAKALDNAGINFNLSMIGPSKVLDDYRTLVQGEGLEHKITIYGELPREEINEYYQKAHFILLPSNAAEGWPKVLSEAMGYGVVVLASDISGIGKYLKELGSGYAYHFSDLQSYSEAIKTMITHPELWKANSENGKKNADLFTYEEYLVKINKLINE